MRRCVLLPFPIFAFLSSASRSNKHFSDFLIFSLWVTRLSDYLLQLHVHFVSDMDYRRRGFKLAYSTAKCPARCGRFSCNATSGRCLCPADRRGDACQFSTAETCPAAAGTWDATKQQCVCKTGRAGKQTVGDTEFQFLKNAANYIIFNILLSFSIFNILLFKVFHRFV